MPRWAVGGVQEVADSATAIARQSPELVVAVVLGLVVLLVGARWLVGYLRSTPAEQLRDVLAAQDEIAVLMHPNPDPDAMSSALAIGELADHVETEVTIVYPGQIRHQENRAFETVLDVDFDRLTDVSQIGDDAVVLVDHNEPRGFAGAEGVEPLAVVDHHPGGGEGDEFTDVRTDHGACASIFAEYFQTLEWEPRDPDLAADGGESEVSDATALASDVATGLLYGIQSDTKHLTKGCSSAEFRAAEYLYEGIDEDRLERIANPQVDAEVLDVKARAISNRVVRNAFAVSNVETISNGDAIPQAADELMTLEGITAVVVYGEKEGTIHVSGRSRDDRVHMGKVLETVVDDIPMADAGGHARMGGGQISVDHMEGLGPKEGMPREQFRERLFDAMTGDV